MAVASEARAKRTKVCPKSASSQNLKCMLTVFNLMMTMTMIVMMVMTMMPMMMPMMAMMMIMFRSDPSKQVNASFSLNVQFSLDFARFLVCFPPLFLFSQSFILFLPQTNEKSLLSGNTEKLPSGNLESFHWKVSSGKFSLECLFYWEVCIGMFPGHFFKSFLAASTLSLCLL